jgi:hypothetical protein
MNQPLFIKLTQIDKALDILAPIRVATAAIVLIEERSVQGARARVTLLGDFQVYVRETPDEIFALATGVVAD